MNEPLHGCELKLYRAYEQIVELEALINEYSQGSYVIERQDKPSKGEIAFRVSEFVPPLEQMAVRIGEVLHNLRCPLDYLICRLVERNGKNISLRNEFPIVESLPAFDAIKANKLKNLSEQECKFVEQLQPYHWPEPRDHPLFLLSRLNNWDKHRVLELGNNALYAINVIRPQHNTKLLREEVFGAAQNGRLIAEFGITDGTDPEDVSIEVETVCDVFVSISTSDARFHPVTVTLKEIFAYIHEQVFASPDLADRFVWCPRYTKFPETGMATNVHTHPLNLLESRASRVE